MVDVEIYRLKKTVEPEVRQYGMFEFFGMVKGPLPENYVREWSGELPSGNLDMLLNDEQRNVFDAVAETVFNSGSAGEIINIVENLDCYRLQAGYNVASYGEFRLEQDWKVCAEVIDRLEKSEDPAERALFKHITLLERTADAEAYSYHAAKEEGGAFTSKGLIIQEEAFKEIYRGVQDIPTESKPLIMLQDTDLSALLLQMHALGGDYMRDANYNINSLTNGELSTFSKATATTTPVRNRREHREAKT
jgi:hypothetical protein